ncbi:hypothetical protein U27_04005 [Candidatus Vecturithrix granuli]|uniref:Response regulator receiver modulated diguanylate cyclase n=1 Tax=Vecturithrix granuli TaxID=1499967 RepID=A0A081BXI6_VECG1|nr:hypothetical protein U27_04005 [Candidatus Vecturithrix granuli]
MTEEISLTSYRITVLLVDDQHIIGEEMRRMLSTEPDVDFHYCQNPVQALKLANKVTPTVILQDLVMPQIDGLTLVRYFRANLLTRDVPIIVLSVKEDAQTKVEAFALGANDYMVKFPDRLEVIARIRYHSRGYINLLQKHEAYEKLKRSMQEEQERTWELAVLNQMSDALQACHAEQNTYAVVAEVFTQLFPYNAGFLSLLNKAGTSLKVEATWGNLPELLQEFNRNQCLALQQNAMYVVGCSSEKRICPHLPLQNPCSYLCEPIVARGETLGLLHLYFDAHDVHDAALFQQKVCSKQAIIHRMAEHYALSLLNLRLWETLRLEAIHDPLTGLYNRRYMEQSLDRELARAERHHTDLGIIMLDIDYFKRFNDTYGHEIGDCVLQKLATYLANNVRDEDIACRYGGEEFMLILPEISLEHLAIRADRLRMSVKQEVTIMHQNMPLTITISSGVACFPTHGNTAQEVKKAADQALYQAKAEGRDRTIVAAVCTR